MGWQQAAGHTIRPAVATASFSPGGAISVEVRVNAEALLTGIGPEHEDTDDAPNAAEYDSLRALPADELARTFETFSAEFAERLNVSFGDQRADLDFVGISVPEVGDLELARDSIVQLKGVVPRDAGPFVWQYPEEYGSSVIRMRQEGGEESRSFWLQAGEASPPVELAEAMLPRPRSEVARDYLVLGFTHILPKGLDHILFVLGIFLLSQRLGPIFWQVTAFTVAHTITLGMTIYGLISLPSSVVEPLIAASIVYVGVENILVTRLRPSRVLLVFCFGLLHGMGFAGVLAEIGLPPSEFLTALITFNIGVEFGQLAVIAVALLAVGAFRGRSWYRQGIVIPASALISLIGAYWTVERLL